MILGFIIWSVVSFIFVIIGIISYRSKNAVGFFTFTKVPTIGDVKKYNKAVAIKWFVFAFLLEVMGLPFLFYEQNSPVFLLWVQECFSL